MAKKYVQIPPEDLVTYLNWREVMHKAAKVVHPGVRSLLVEQALQGSQPVKTTTWQALLATVVAD